MYQNTWPSVREWRLPSASRKSPWLRPLSQATELAEHTAKIALLEEARRRKEDEVEEWQLRVSAGEDAVGGWGGQQGNESHLLTVLWLPPSGTSFVWDYAGVPSRGRGPCAEPSCRSQRQSTHGKTWILGVSRLCWAGGLASEARFPCRSGRAIPDS